MTKPLEFEDEDEGVETYEIRGVKVLRTSGNGADLAIGEVEEDSLKKWLDQLVGTS